MVRLWLLAYLGLASANNNSASSSSANATANATTAAAAVTKAAAAAGKTTAAPKGVEGSMPVGKSQLIPFKGAKAAATTPAATTAAAGNASANGSRRVLMEVRDLAAATASVDACKKFLKMMYVTNAAGRAAMEEAIGKAAGDGVDAHIATTATVNVDKHEVSAAGFLNCIGPIIRPVTFHGSAVDATKSATEIYKKFTDDGMKALTIASSEAIVTAVKNIVALGTADEKKNMAEALGHAAYTDAIGATIEAAASTAAAEVKENIAKYTQTAKEAQASAEAADAAAAKTTAAAAAAGTTAAAATSGSATAFVATGVLAALASLL